MNNLCEDNIIEICEFLNIIDLFNITKTCKNINNMKNLLLKYKIMNFDYNISNLKQNILLLSIYNLSYEKELDNLIYYDKNKLFFFRRDFKFISNDLSLKIKLDEYLLNLYLFYYKKQLLINKKKLNHFLFSNKITINELFIINIKDYISNLIHSSDIILKGADPFSFLTENIYK